MPSFDPAPLLGSLRGQFVPQPLGEAPAAFRPAPPGGGGGAQPEIDLEAICSEARARGYAEGREAGAREAQIEALRPAMQALEEAARGLDALRRHYLERQRRAVVDLALAVAERLLARAVEADPGLLAGVVERALDALGDAPPTRVLLCPEDLARGRTVLAGLLDRLEGEHGIALDAHPALASGDVRVLAGDREVDARRAELLRRVRAEFLESLHVEEEGA